MQKIWNYWLKEQPYRVTEKYARCLDLPQDMAF